MINRTYALKAFTQEEFKFEGATCFEGQANSLLLSKDGGSIIISNNMVASIVAKSVSEDLAFKLFQRGFATVYAQRYRKVSRHIIEPTFFMIDFTTKCNCNCIYCLRHFDDVGESITDNQLHNICNFIINYCHSHRICSIGFQPWGGEPLIEIEKIIQCKQLFNDAGINVNMSVQTNGLLLNTANYQLLKENGISVGISLDGDSISHDVHRVDVSGKVTHKKICENIMEIKGQFPQDEICTISVNSQYSLQHIKDNIQYLVEKLGVRYLKFNLVHPNGDDFDYSMLIQEEQIQEYVHMVVSSIVEEIKKGYSCTEANIAGKLVNILNNSDNDLCHSSGCCGGENFISFDQDGNIYPCEMIGNQTLRIGNINDGADLIEMIQCFAKTSSYFADRGSNECLDCPYFSYCRGGCRACAMAYGKAPNEVDRIECLVNKALYPLLIDLILEDPETVNTIIEGRVRIK